MLRQTPETSIGTSIVKKKDTQGIPHLKRKNGKGAAQSDLEKAKEFNGQFTDVFSENEHTQVPLLDRSAPFLNDIAVSKDGVIKLLKGLNPPRVLKELATELGLVFAHLLSNQLSIGTGEIPKEWSLANICPLFKKSDRSLARNYRPFFFFFFFFYLCNLASYLNT